MNIKVETKTLPEDSEKLNISQLIDELKEIVRDDTSLGFGEVETGITSESARFLQAIRKVLDGVGFLSIPLLELTIFDPEDLNDHRFYTIVEADSPQSLDLYRSEMEKNVEPASSTNSSEIRGPIIPNPDLYQSVLWWAQLPVEEDVKVNADPRPEKFRIVGAFSVSDDSIPKQVVGDTHPTTSLLEKYITSFVSRVAETLTYASRDETETETYRCFMLVPFSRPSSRYASQSERGLHRGGGLFVFGSLKRDYNKNTADEQLLAIGSVLARILSDSVLRYSHTQVETTRASSEGYQRALNAFSHQIRETAAGAGSNWLMEPSRWASAVERFSKSGGFSKQLTEYKIAPAPELFKGLRTTLSLWAQSRRWQDLFLWEQRLPENLAELLELAFDYASDLRSVASFRNANVQDWETQLPLIWERTSLDFMNKKTHLQFGIGTDIELDPSDIILAPPPSPEDRGSLFFVDLCESLRLFVAVFDNYMGRGDITKPIIISVFPADQSTPNQELRLVFSNSRRDEEGYGSANLWPGARGKDIIYDLASRLRGRIVWPDIFPGTKSFRLQMNLPLQPLWEIRSGREGHKP